MKEITGDAIQAVGGQGKWIDLLSFTFSPSTALLKALVGPNPGPADDSHTNAMGDTY